MEKLEDGLYQAQSGNLRKLDIEDDGLKKIRVTPEVFEAVRAVQKQMRRRLGGRKPDVSLVAEAMLMFAARAEGIEDKVKRYAASVYAE
jgi:thymidylate kinase